MTDRSHERLAAFGQQLIEVHYWLRDSLEDLREQLDDYYAGRGLPAADLRAHCLTFCSALTRHHTGEEREAFPEIAAEHPELQKVLSDLRTDHNQIEWIMGKLQKLLDGLPSSGADVRAEVDALSAIMQTHFVYEEKKLITVLNDMDIPEWRHNPPSFLHSEG